MFGNHLSPPVQVMIVLIVAGAFLSAVLVPLALLLRYRRLRCQLVHEERMKAIEAGYPLGELDAPQNPSRHMQNAFRLSLGMGVVFPVAAVLAGAWATRASDAALGRVLSVWISVAVACMTAVICAAIVLARSRAQPAAQAETSRLDAPGGAPPGRLA